MIDSSVYTVYHCKDGRTRCYNKITKKVVSYPRILMEEKLGRPLEPYEQVHHKDENPLNNSLDNLEITKLGEHQREHSLKYRENITVKCVRCNKDFNLTPKQQSNRVRESNRGKNGPFCSRSCSGKYGKEEQLRRNAKTECP